MFWASGGAAASALSQALILVVLARLAGAEVLGRYALATAVVAPAMLLARLQLRTIAASQHDGTHAPRTFLHARLLISGGVAALLATAAWFFFPPVVASAVALLALVRLIEDLGELSWGFLQRRSLWPVIAASQAMHGLGSAIAFTAAFALSSSLSLGLAAAALWRLAVFLSFDLGRSQMTAVTVETSEPLAAAGALIRECGWLGPAAALVSLNGHLPRLALERWDSLESVGVFAALGQIPLLGNLAVQSLGQVQLRSLTEAARTNTAAFRRSLSQLTAAALAVAVCGTVIAAVLGETILTLCFGGGFSQYSDELVWLMAASAPLYLAGVWGYAWVAQGERRLQFWVYAVAVSSNLFAAALWTPLYGLRGAIAAYGTGWSAAALGCLWGLFSRMQPARRSEFAPSSEARYN